MIININQICRNFTQPIGNGLFRQKKTISAIHELSFCVEAGEAIGYIGANGSGKSTTIKMLTGILMPSSGTIKVCGLNPVPDRKKLAHRLGVLFGQRSLLWWDLPLKESYPILAAMHRRPASVWKKRYDELVDGLELADFLQTPVRSLSLGQRMRGELAAALIHEPELIVLDEPTIGLDVLSKERLRAFLNRERSERGTTLLLTTHDMGDVQRLCSRMIIIDRGRKVFDGDETELSKEVGAERLMNVDAVEDVPLLELPDGARVILQEGTRATIAFDAHGLSAADLLTAVTHQVNIMDISLAEPTIEDLVKRIYLRESRAKRNS